MDKRVLMFLDSNKKVQEELKFRLENHLEENFGQDYKKEIEIQTFYDIHESFESKKKIGLGGEVLVILDSRLYPRDTKDLYSASLTALLNMLRTSCEKGEIPFMSYAGEIEKKQDNVLLKNLGDTNQEVKERLSKLEKESVDSSSTNRF